MLPNKFWVILKLIPRVANQSCVHHLIFGLNKIDFIEGVQGGPRGRSPLAVWHFRTTLRFKLSILKLSWPAECTANSTNNFSQAGQLRRDDLTTNKSTACQHYLQRPRGTSRVLHWFSIENCCSGQKKLSEGINATSVFFSSVAMNFAPKKSKNDPVVAKLYQI